MWEHRSDMRVKIIDTIFVENVWYNNRYCAIPVSFIGLFIVNYWKLLKKERSTCLYRVTINCTFLFYFLSTLATAIRPTWLCVIRLTNLVRKKVWVSCLVLICFTFLCNRSSALPARPLPVVSGKPNGALTYNWSRWNSKKQKIGKSQAQNQ